MFDPVGLKQLARLAIGRGMRSTVLIDLRWLVGLSMLAFVISVTANAAT